MPSAKVKRARRKQTSEIREKVMARAGWACEACEQPVILPLEMDHFFGGSLRRVMEAVETCWGLCRRCHRNKTDNLPSRAYWLERFIEHTRKFGYVDAAALASAKLEAQLLMKGPA